MGLTATGSNREFRPAPEGSHMAVCFRVIDLGTQQWEYQGEPQIAQKVLIQWELHGESEDGAALTTDDGQPLSVSKKYTLSLGKKAKLRADLESWRGRAFTDAELKGFDVSGLLGAPCMVTIKHDHKGEKTYANVASVSRFPAALKDHKPRNINKLELFDLSKPNEAIYSTLPEWVRTQIDQSVERSKRKPAQSVPPNDDSVPFDEEPPF